MSEYSFDENYANLIRQEIASIAKALLARKMCFLLGARKISLLRHTISAKNDDNDLLTFSSIDTETSHLPLDELYQYAEKQILPDLQGEMDASERWARIVGEPACESIVKRFGS